MIRALGPRVPARTQLGVLVRSEVAVLVEDLDAVVEVDVAEPDAQHQVERRHRGDEQAAAEHDSA